jgi:hypothetical protein
MAVNEQEQGSMRRPFLGRFLRGTPLIALFLLGIFEVVFPHVAVLISDSYHPEFRADYLRLGLKAQEQMSFFEGVYAFVTWKLGIITVFGVLTIFIGVLILCFGSRDHEKQMKPSDSHE